jgi:Sec-independent protein translocase protein TatA/RNA polymerase subunit RPABC4/transcription elongation factor Spt4
MFGINLEELIVLAVLAFILFGPQKLPEYAEKLGRLVAKLRAASTEVTQQFQNPFQYPPEPGLPQQPSPNPEHTTCPSCFQTVGREFKFCPGCGRRLEEEKSAPEPSLPGYAACPGCHRTIAGDYTFCPHCGHRMKGEAPAPPPAQQPQAS